MSEGSVLPANGECSRPGWSYISHGGTSDPEGSSFGTVEDWLVRAASEHPSRNAITWLDRGRACGLTWHELYERASAIGSAIQSRVSGRRRLGILGRDRVDWILAMYGAARAGCAVVPLPFGETPERLADCCDRVGIDLVVTTGDLTLAPEVLPALEVVGVAHLEASGGRFRDDVERPKTDDPFLFQLTSGTTGRPKVAVLSHRAVLGSARHYATAAGAADGAIMFNPLPLEHVGGVVGGVISALTVAGTYIAVGRFDPRSTVEAIRRLRPGVVGLVPTMVVDILSLDGVVADDFASVTAVVGGATSVDPTLIDSMETRLSTKFLVAYGQSEAPCLTMSAPDDPLHERTRTLGRPLPGRDYCVIAEGTLAEEGEIGELCVRGPLIMSGYLDEDGRVISMCDENGWMRTGDLCSMREGIVTFHSRLREVVIRGGENLYPAEIESALTEFDGIQEVVVFGVADSRLGERPVAAVLPFPGVTISEANLEAFASTRLSRQKRPTQWFLVNDFPRTTTGKIRRLGLADWIRDTHG
ncbi:class I adenylate-forming enzyme family protein [Prescottella equi]